MDISDYEGSVILKALLDASNVKDGLDRLQKETSTAVGKWKVGFLAAGAAAAAAGAAAIKVGKDAIAAYADYEQLVGGVETLFGESAGVVEAYADEAYKNAGLSANAYMETITGFSASLLQSLGGDTQKAAEMGNTAVIDMADNANKMGTAMEAIQNAYQGFAKQNYTMLDNLKLGYGGTKSEMERLLADANRINAEMGILTDYDINSFADIVDAIHVVQVSMGIAGTTAEEAEGTIQGSISSMKGAWTNLLVGFADGTQDLNLLLNNFVDSVVIVGQNLLPRIGQVLSSLAQICLTKAGELGKKLLDEAIDIGKNIVDGLWQGIKARIAAVKDKAAASLGEITDSVRGVFGIHSPSRVFARIGEYCMEGLAIGMQDSSGKVIKTQTALSKAILSYAKQGAEELRKTNKATAQEEAEFWQDLIASGRLSSKELSQAKVLAAKASAQASKDSYEASKDWLDEQVDYNRMSASELVGAWQRVVDRGELLADEQKKAVQQLLKAQKQLSDEVERLESTYRQALESRTAEIMGSFDLFGGAPAMAEVSADELLGNMRDQQQVMQQWADEMALLAARGLDESFVAAVRDKGPDALGELLALNGMSDEQLAEYARMWQGLNEQAGLAAAAELAGLRAETDRQIADLLGGVEDRLNSESPEVGEALSSGLAAGILDGRSSVVNAAASVAAAAVRAAKRALEINSPSKKFRYLGQMTDAGFVGGINDGIRDVKAAISDVLAVSATVTPVAVESGRALTGGTTREVITNNRTVEKVARIEGDGMNNAFVSRLRIRLRDEDTRVGAALGV